MFLEMGDIVWRGGVDDKVASMINRGEEMMYGVKHLSARDT